jgi:hypothetical protein
LRAAQYASARFRGRKAIAPYGGVGDTYRDYSQERTFFARLPPIRLLQMTGLVGALAAGFLLGYGASYFHRPRWRRNA